MTCGRILFYLCWDFVGFISNLRCHMLLIPPFSPPLLFLLRLSDSLPVLLSGASMAVDAETHFHVLAVDDNLIDRKVIEKLLKSSSFHVTAVDSGSKALKFLGLQSDQEIENPFPQAPDHHVVEVNLIITDYCMPGMTGYDLLKRVKESSSFRDIPVVIMSSENVPSRIDRCLAEGAEEFLLKPVRRFDISRFRPHILKAKHRGRQQPELHQKPQTLQEQEHQEQELQQEEKQQQPSNKRKAADEGLVQESRRPRLSGLTVL